MKSILFLHLTNRCSFAVQVVRAVYHRRNSETVQAMSNILELAQTQIQKHLLSLKVGMVSFFKNFFFPRQCGLSVEVISDQNLVILFSVCILSAMLQQEAI